MYCVHPRTYTVKKKRPCGCNLQGWEWVTVVVCAVCGQVLRQV